MKKSLLMILSVISLIGCVNKPVVIEDTKEVVDGTATLLLQTLPSLPDPPEFPARLNWGYQEPVYTLDEDGTDKLLEFRDIDYSDFKYDLETWKMQFDAVKSKISDLNI